MRLSLIAWCAGGILAAGCLAVAPPAADAENFKLQGRVRGHCKLTNMAVGRELYNGTCVIKQAPGAPTVISIKMGNTEPFLFATTDGSSWMHGPEKVTFRDRGHTGIFRWGDFRLEVDDAD